MVSIGHTNIAVADTVTVFGSGVDTTVGKLASGYNNRGLLIRSASHNPSGAVLNEIAWDYNDFNQPAAEYQEHSGAVNKTTSLKVGYTHAGGPYTGITNLQQQENFTFDETGNWKGYQSTSPTLVQTRSHNVANQITGIANPSGVAAPVYDAVGNMTTMPSALDWTQGDHCKWDAWNRLVSIRRYTSSSSSSSSSSGSSSAAARSLPASPGATPPSTSTSPATPQATALTSSSSSSSSTSPASFEATYIYDALTRRIRKTAGGETRDFYFDRQWRCLEERVGGLVKADYTYNPSDRWNLIRRRRATTGSTLNETRFVLRDYLDPVTIVTTEGAVDERYGYDTFGSVRIMCSNFVTRDTSACAWNWLFHGEFIDLETGLYNYGYRYYHPKLGRWPSRDPIGEIGGLNLYGFVFNNPNRWIDILGREPNTPNPWDVREGYNNCAAHALEQKNSIEPKDDKSWKDVSEKLGYACTPKIGAKECEKHCGKCENFVMLYITKHPSKKKVIGNIKDPISLPGVNFGPGTPVDFHFLHGRSEGTYSYIPNFCKKGSLDDEWKWLPSDENDKRTEGVREENTYEKYCCCKKNSK
jgi:RHS repeat-associated protein